MSLDLMTRRFGARRMLLATIVLALLYIGVGQLVMSVGLSFAPVVSDHQLGKIEDEARRVAVESAARESTIRPEYRLAVWRIGLRLGYASQYLGAHLRSAAGDDPARHVLSDWLTQTQRMASAMGLGEAQPLPVQSLADFVALHERIDADQNGLAARIESRMSARHSHLYLLGMHVGVLWAQLRAAAEHGLGASERPDGRLDTIARHATLAGLSRAQWKPLTQVPATDSAKDDLAAYQRVIDDAEQAIATIGAPVAP